MSGARTRRAFTLMELTVSLAISAMLMAALGSAVAIAAASLPEANSSQTRILNTSRTLERLSADLEGSLYVLDTTPDAPLVGIPDRNKDGAPDTLALTWSGSRTEPLQLIENGATPESVLEQASAFTTSMRTISVTETLTSSDAAAPEEQFAALETATSSDSEKVHFEELWGSIVKPTLPADATSWTPTRVEVSLKRSGRQNDEVLVQLREVSGARPQDNVLGEGTYAESDLTGSFAWIEFDMSGAPAMSVEDSVAIVVGNSGSDNNAAEVELENGSGSGLWRANISGMVDGDSTPWSLDTDARQILYRLHGTYVAPAPSGSVEHHFVTSVQVSVSAAGAADVDLETLVNLVNRPQIVDSIWQAEFWTDPTAHDINADGIADWAVDGGGPVLDSFLSDGCWKVRDVIRTQPAKDMPGPVIAHIRWRDTHQGQDGATWTLNFDQSGGFQGNVRLYVNMISDTEQTLDLVTTDGTTNSVLASVDGLGTDLIEARVVVDPVNDIVALSIDGVEIGAYRYLSAAYTDDERVSIIEPVGNGVEIDYVRIREGGTP